MTIYRFADTLLEPHRAHSGKGRVMAARVRERMRHSPLNFIDLVEIPAGVEIGVHRHARTDEEIYIVIEGTAEMSINGRTECVAPGDVIVNSAGSAHGLKNLSAHTVRLVVIDISIDGSAYEPPIDLE